MRTGRFVAAPRETALSKFSSAPTYRGILFLPLFQSARLPAGILRRSSRADIP